MGEEERAKLVRGVFHVGNMPEVYGEWIALYCMWKWKEVWQRKAPVSPSVTGDGDEKAGRQHIHCRSLSARCQPWLLWLGTSTGAGINAAASFSVNSDKTHLYYVVEQAEEKWQLSSLRELAWETFELLMELRENIWSFMGAKMNAEQVAVELEKYFYLWPYAQASMA